MSNVAPLIFDDWLEVEEPVIKTDLWVSQDFTVFHTDENDRRPYQVSTTRVTSGNIEEIKEDFRLKVKDVEYRLQQLMKTHEIYKKLFPHLKKASQDIAKKVKEL